MTEKQYGGASSHGLKNKASANASLNQASITSKKEISSEDNIDDSVSVEAIEKLKKAGSIAKEVIIYAKSIIKKDMSLLEIAAKIEAKIVELGARPAFPVTLSINEIAAHATPTYNDSSVAYGLLKVDLGVHIDGYVADTAFSVD